MNNYEQLQNTLKEVFEIDKADLDFGIYRIMNQKRGQVMDFIDNQLPKEIKEILAATQSKDGVALQAELDKMGKALDEASVVRESSPKYITLQQQIANSIDTNALEQEVFSHLASFFKRYYKEGDFISMRRYKKDVYAIPYEGEEVKLHWANHDQYYIKTSEYLKNYSFKLKDGKIVHFQLKEATTEQNNIKTQGELERRFAIYAELPLEVENNELYVNFSYELHKKNVKQDELNKIIFTAVQQNVPADFVEIFGPYIKRDGKLKTRKDNSKDVPCEIFYHHLNDFISRNSFDYFIHKDLGGFLRRELDFYIKNEVLFIDDINTENPAFFIAQVSKVKALKTVACKVIDFIAQVENFQKKLWLKKKFVTSTNYMITLDRIPEKYFEEIGANEAQFTEWKALFGVKVEAVNLKEHPYIVLDTKFFSEEFKDRLIAEFDDLDAETDGLLLNSENFQALNMLQEKYKEQVDVCYFDPPYNTNATPILYKNDYRESTWLSLINDRLILAKKLLNEIDGAFSVAIDDAEIDVLTRLLKTTLFDFEIHKVIVNHYPGSGTGRSNVSRTHEYNLFAIPFDSDILRGNLKPDGLRERNFRRAGTGENNYRIGRPNSFFALLVDKNSFEIVGLENPPQFGIEYPVNDTSEGYKRIYPIGSDGAERVWSLSYEGAKLALNDKMLFCTSSYTINRLYNDEGARDLVQSLWTSTKYSATVFGTNLLTDMFNDSGLFSYPKSLYTVKTAIDVISFDKKKSTILDYFAGSGTTGHAVIKLNRDDYGKRKYILVEMGTYFNTVTKPRIAKVIYSDNWKGGVPQDTKGISQIVKYQTLESYEDVLNNLVLAKKSAADLFTEAAKEQYQLKYMLDLESRDHLFDIDIFRNPFSYALNVTQNNEQVPTVVDLVETFNYLIGLYVQRMQRVKDDKRDIKLVEGKTREGKNTLVIWRNLEITSNEETQKVFRKIYDGVRSAEFDQIYINGDHHFENLRIGDDNFKIKLIEEVFFKKMFEG